MWVCLVRAPCGVCGVWWSGGVFVLGRVVGTESGVVTPFTFVCACMRWRCGWQEVSALCRARVHLFACVVSCVCFVVYLFVHRC